MINNKIKNNNSQIKRIREFFQNNSTIYLIRTQSSQNVQYKGREEGSE